MGMDSYLPDVDGVVMCMHNYCLALNDKVELDAMAPKNDPRHVDTFPYRLTRCKSKVFPIIRMYYGKPEKDKKFKTLIYGQKFDIIHMHSPFNMSKFALKLAKKTNTPAVATFHTNFRPIFKSVVKLGFISEFMVKRVGKALGKYDEIFVCTPEVEEQARSFGYRGKVSFIPFGCSYGLCADPDTAAANANMQFGIAANETVFLFVGRLMELKRVDFILDCLKVLKDGGAKFRFIIVGKGPHAEKLQQQAKTLGFTDKEVNFMGFVSDEDLKLLYARSDLFLFPSLYDNFGLVKIEAAAYSTPCLLIRDSAAGYGVADGVNGFLCDDSLESFTGRIREILQNPASLKQVGKNAARDIYRSWDDCGKILLENYARVINEKQQNIKHTPVPKSVVTLARRNQKRKSRKIKSRGASG